MAVAVTVTEMLAVAPAASEPLVLVRQTLTFEPVTHAAVDAGAGAGAADIDCVAAVVVSVLAVVVDAFETDAADIDCVAASFVAAASFVLAHLQIAIEVQVSVSPTDNVQML